MTSKDYELLATALKSRRPDIADPRCDYWHSIVLTVANALAQDNPRFVRTRFVQACTA